MTKMENWDNARHKRDQRRTVWFEKEKVLLERRGRGQENKSAVIFNNTKNDVDSHNIGQVAESETKRDSS